MAFTLKQVSKQITTFGTKPETEDFSQYQHITCTINRFVYKDEESGFFVLAAQIPEGHPNARGTVDGKTFIVRKFVIVGTSLIMTQAVVEGQEIDVWGEFEPGKQADSVQFSAKAIQEKIPTKPKAIELFLSSGKIYGIGKVTARKIVSEFGAKTIEILDKDPELLLTVDGVSQKKLELIKQSWQEWRQIYEIVATMRLYGIGDSAGVKIFSHFKEKSIHIIKNEPYDLTDVATIGFRTADKIALQIGKSTNDEKRIEKCILYTMEEISNDGHTAYAKEELAYKTNDLLDIEIELVQAKIEELIEKGLLIAKKVKVKSFVDKYKTQFKIVEKDGVAHSKMHNTELRIAKELKRIMDYPLLEDKEENQKNISHFLSANPFKLDKSQLDAANIILNNKVSILTGGPGTGKTHTIKSLLSYFDSIGQVAVSLLNDEDEESQSNHEKARELVSVLSAPTGRASKRMEEATGKAGSTMHRLLGFKDGQFVHNDLNKLSGDVFFVDESSMIDIWLGNGFLKAIPSHARIIFVGDIDQLEAVGAGNFLKDMIESNYIPVARLKEIHRQALNSNIIVAAYDIIHRKVPKIYDIQSDSDFVFVEKEGKEAIHDEITSIIKNLIKQGVSVDDIQVLSPRKESEVGTHSLNESLRPILNPEFHQYKDVELKFIPGDRVMQFKNNRDLDIFNGDVGKILALDTDNAGLQIMFDGKLIEVGGQDLSNINFCYATTIHKSQGSDYPYVIIPLSSSHTFMWNANLLYTAVTRGKTRVILVGEKKTLFSCVASFKQSERITGLKDEIIKLFSDSTLEHTIQTITPILKPQLPTVLTWGDRY